MPVNATGSLRNLPGVDRLLQADTAIPLIEAFGRETVLNTIRTILDEIRSNLRKEENPAIPDSESILGQVSERLTHQFQTTLHPVINATGVILHTNLGRAPLAKSAIEAIQAVGSGYSSLEFNLETGKRGKRQTHIEDLIAEVTGAESAMIVNNCAAAVMMVLSAFAKDREVIISRGQLVEIGGGFRIPDVMAQSGAKLIEVGTTNRTRLADYERAITDETAMLMRAHASNFKIMGFTEVTPLEEIVKLAYRHNLYVFDDLGSGTLINTAQFGMTYEPMIQDSLAARVDIITFSGDKLLGGPQAGLIIGRKTALDVLKKHPLARALRVDKLTIAAMVATLDLYRRGQALTHIPVWQMISRSLESIEATAKQWANIIPGELIPGESTIGGGSLPGETLPTMLFSPKVKSAQQAQTRLRNYDPPIIARVKDDRLLLDPRTVLPDALPIISAALQTL